MFGEHTKSPAWRDREKLSPDLIARLAGTNQKTNRCGLKLFNMIADFLEEVETEGKETIGRGDDQYHLIPVVTAIKTLVERGLPLGILRKHRNYKEAGRTKDGKKVGDDAVAFIERGILNHSQINNELLKQHKYKSFTKKQVRQSVKEKVPGFEAQRPDSPARRF